MSPCLNYNFIHGQKFWFYEQIEFYPSGGTTFKVIGERFIAIDNLTVGFVDSEVRLLI